MADRLMKVQQRKARRANRVRSKVEGTGDRPRLHVNVSNKHVSAQVIDDSNQATLIATSTVGKKLESKTLTEKAEWVGTDIAKKAGTKKITKVTLDRGSRLYHGRVKALAEAARNAGLEL